MLGRVIRVLIGFALASLVAAFTLVAFVYAPGEWASLRSDLSGERLAEASLFALVVTPHVAMSAILPALAGVVFAEARKVGRWTFYALAGICIAAAGFLVQHLSEAPEETTILSNYALVAFLTSGFAGGLAYWAFSGRFAVAGPTAVPDAKPLPGPTATAGALPPAAGES
jgi:hypothetical protein